MTIPFVDLKEQYLSIKDKIDSAISSVISETAFIGGKYVKEFENSWEKFLGIKNCVACANGTDSIEILLKAMGIGAGDEVIVPAISWISTSEAVSTVGATPIFVDIDPDYYTIDEKLIEGKINKKTKAIIPVHLYGQAANMPVIMELARKYSLKVIEDCAQAHAAEIENKKLGTWGDAASFSFYPGKNLGAYGDAGCMVTNDDEVAAKARMIANHGQLKKHHHRIEGRNSRLDSLQAAILSVKLPHLDEWTGKRINAAKVYNENLDTSVVKIPKIRKDSKHVFHLYVIRTDKRSGLISYLKDKGVETAVHYPTALPLLPAYSSFNYSPRDFPIASQYQDQILSLPMYPELSGEMISYVVSNLNSY